MTELEWPKDLTPSGQVFKNRVDNPMMFRAYMMAKMPTLGVTGAHLSQIEVGACRVELPFGRTTKDLFGRLSTSAVVTAAEAASVSLLVLNIRNQQAAVVPRVRTLRVEAMRDVHEPLTLICERGLIYGEFVAMAKLLGEPLPKELVVEAQTAKGEVTHRVYIEWELAPKGA